MVWLANPERYGQMQYRYCGKSGLRLPALSLGLWHNSVTLTRWNHSA